MIDGDRGVKTAGDEGVVRLESDELFSCGCRRFIFIARFVCGRWRLTGLVPSALGAGRWGWEGGGEAGVGGRYEWLHHAGASTWEGFS